MLFRADPEILAVRRLPEARTSDLAEPYLREVEGEVYGQEYWDATPGLTVMQQLVDGALVAQATGSVLIVPGRRWERPVHVADEITAESARVLTTVLFTAIVGSTRRAAELGDDRWRQVLAEHYAIVREQIRRFRGREVDTAGDGFLVAFDGAARDVQCVMAIRTHLRRIGLEIRSGIHAGECEESGGKLVGIAVHIGSRLLGIAQPGEILVSSTVRDLVAG